MNAVFYAGQFQIWVAHKSRIHQNIPFTHRAYYLCDVRRASSTGLWLVQLLLGNNRPFHNTSAPVRLHLPVPHVSTKPLKSSLQFTRKDPFYIWNKPIKYCNRYYSRGATCIIQGGYHPRKKIHVRPHKKTKLFLVRRFFKIWWGREVFFFFFCEWAIPDLPFYSCRCWLHIQLLSSGVWVT